MSQPRMGPAANFQANASAVQKTGAWPAARVWTATTVSSTAMGSLAALSMTSVLASRLGSA
jgi:hypothetical protein